MKDRFDLTEGEVFLLDKPYRWTSFDVVGKVRSILFYAFNIRLKVGHAGTLDPLASGLMIVCTGKKTKTIDQIQSLYKEYIATITFGATTPSFDLETALEGDFPVDHISKEKIEDALKTFLGKQLQVPPVFSAKWVDGARAYNKARKGIAVEIKPSEIEIYELEILDYVAPVLTVRIACSKGTYIRSFANDLGKALNSGAHLAGLKRTKVGEFNLENAITIQQFEEMFANRETQKLA
jgi:tRNA pseudouridine55 synthase